MPKYLLLKHYTGGPAAPLPNYAPMDEWTPEEITAHMAFQHEVTRMLTGRLGKKRGRRRAQRGGRRRSDV